MHLKEQKANLTLKDLLQEKALQISVRFAKKDRACPQCRSRLTMYMDAVSIYDGESATHSRMVIYCVSPDCRWWISLIQELPSGFRIDRP